MGLRILTAAAAVITALAGPAVAHAAPTWFPAPTFPDAGDAFVPRVAVGPGNDTVAAWVAKDAGGHAISIASLPPGPGTPTTVSFSRGAALNDAGVFPPAVAVAPTGDAIVAWKEGSRQIGYSLRQAPGDFGPPQLLEDTNTGGKDKTESPVAVAADGQGNFLVAAGNELPAPFGTGGKNTDRVLVWSIDGGSGLATGPQRIGEVTGDVTHPMTELSMAENAAGHAALAYRQAVTSGTGEDVLSTSNATAGGPLNPAVGVLEFDASQPRVAVDPAGREIYSVRHDPVAGGTFGVRAFEAQPDGTLARVGPDASGTISDPAKASGESEVAIDATGEATVVWQTCTGCGGAGASRAALAQRVSPAGQAEGTPEPLSGSDPDPDFLNPQISVAPGGAAVAVWKRVVNGKAQLEWARRATATGTFSQPTAIPVDTGVTSPSLDFTGGSYLASDSLGDAALVWERDAGAVREPHLARLDAVPPSAGAITTTGLPATPFDPLTFTLSPTDRVSATSASWTFGDGGTAPGETVRHTYQVGGQRAVVATVTDAAGFTASASTSFDLGQVDPGGGGGPKAKPRFTGSATLTHARFAVSSKRTALTARKPKAKKPPKGTTFRFGLSARAKVTISFARLAAGRRKGKRCVAPTRKLKAAHAKRCTRAVKVDKKLTRTLGKGRRSVAFSGRLGRTPLARGSYKAALGASNAAGRAKARTLAFTIVKG